MRVSSIPYMVSWFNHILRRVKPGSNRVYLDVAATTPVRPEVLAEMQPYWSRQFGNAGALYEEGREAAAALARARTQVARTLSVRSEEVTFTSGGTEANNLALVGFIRARLRSGLQPKDLHVISTEIEHSSVLAPLRELEALRVQVSFVPVTPEGRIDLAALASLLRPETCLISVHLVNNEIGTIQPIRDVARLLSQRYAPEARPRLHTDASQAPLFLDCSLERLGADLMTLDGQKIYGPKGIGVLVHRRSTELVPIMVGGGQEGGLRAGTEPLALAAGFARALQLAAAEREVVEPRVRGLRDHFIKELLAAVPRAQLNGTSKDRIANNVNVSIPGIDTEFLVIHLDKEGVAVSTKSTCLADEPGSYTVAALGKSRAHAISTLRITLGTATTEGELTRTAQTIAALVEKLDNK